MSLLINLYAKIIYSLCIFLIRSTYKQPVAASFSVDKHIRMIKLSGYGIKVFNLLTGIVGKKTKYNYTMPVEYEGCKLLIRPFIVLEIILTSGVWEPYVRAILDKELKASDVIVDVGANIGIYTIPLAKKASKVIAFEPHPKSSQMLEESIKLNRLHNITLIKKPVADSRRKILLDLSTDPIYSRVASATEKIGSTIESETITLDSCIDMESNRVDWLLIDVEGFEKDVLNGARNVLRKHSPKIIIEIFDRHFKEVSEILKNEGYSITNLYRAYYYAVKSKGAKA